MKAPNWGIFKGVHNGDGIYWNGSYNVEGTGSYDTQGEAMAAIDAKRQAQETARVNEAIAKAAAGKAILCHREGDEVTCNFKDGVKTVSIRHYRQNIFDWEEQTGMEFIIL